MPGNARPESALVVVTTGDGLVLLLKRLVPPGAWQSVTGGLETNESPRDAAIREVREETGIDIDALPGARLIDCDTRTTFEIWPEWRERYPAGVTHNTEHQFRLELARRVDVKTNPVEHDAHVWLPLAQASMRATFPTDRAAIERLAQLTS